MLNAHNKLTIRMIDQQMKELDKRKTSDAEMLKILSDFVPDVKYMLAASGAKEIKNYLNKNPFFASFVRLVQRVK